MVSMRNPALVMVSAWQPMNDELVPTAPPETPWMSQPWSPLEYEVTPVKVLTIGLDSSIPAPPKLRTVNRSNASETVAGLLDRDSTMPLPEPVEGPRRVKSCSVNRVMSVPVTALAAAVSWRITEDPSPTPRSVRFDRTVSAAVIL